MRTSRSFNPIWCTVRELPKNPTDYDMCQYYLDQMGVPEKPTMLDRLRELHYRYQERMIELRERMGEIPSNFDKNDVTHLREQIQRLVARLEGREAKK